MADKAHRIVTQGFGSDFRALIYKVGERSPWGDAFVELRDRFNSRPEARKWATARVREIESAQ